MMSFITSTLKKYPESYDPQTPQEVVYVGSKKLTDEIDAGGQTVTVGKLVLSPTHLPSGAEKLLEALRQIHGT